jgi:hypothetical protein
MKWRDPQLLGITPLWGKALAVMMLERSSRTGGTFIVARHWLGPEVSTDSDERRPSGVLEGPSMALCWRTSARSRRLNHNLLGQITLALQCELNHGRGIQEVHLNLSLGPDVHHPDPLLSSSAISRSIREPRFDV